MLEDIDMSRQKLTQWEAVGEQLWPFVRFFPLCGGDLRAIEAVAEMAKLLGKTSECHLERADTSKAVNQTLVAVADHFETHFFRKMLHKDAEAYLKSLEELA